MLTIDAQHIQIPEDRQRKEFPTEAQAELVDSIQTLGLIQPIVLREGSTLAAGERRLRACKVLIHNGIQIKHGKNVCPTGHIPYIDFGSLSATDAAEVELHENIKRLDITWQERARAYEKLRDLRAQTSAIPPTISELAKETHSSSERTGTMLMLARHLDDPEVAKAATPTEAAKIVKKKAESAQRLREAFVNPTSQINSQHTISNEDARTFLRSLPAASFDVILTDPPYGVGADGFGEQSSGHEYDDSYATWLNLMPAVLSEGFRVTKSNAHAYIFCDPRRYEDIIAMARRAGWNPWHVPLIWNKRNGTLPEPEYGPRRTYEMIVYLRKGNRKVLQVLPDVLEYSPVVTKIHPAQKPIELYLDLLSRSAEPGQTVLDPFLGSGTLFPAANLRKLIATGCENNMSNFVLARSRMEGTV